MSYGVQFKNKFGNVLITSFTQNLHLFERIDDAVVAEENSRWRGRYVMTYTSNLSTSYKPVPFFTIPYVPPYPDLDRSYQEQYVGISRIFQSNGRWKIELLTNKNSKPQVYLFTEAAGAPSYGDYGLTIRNRNGRAAFDSSKAPLVIAGEYNGFTMRGPPSSPRPSSSNLSARNGSSNGSASHALEFLPEKYTRVGHPNATLPNKPMFSYSSTPQAQMSTDRYEYRRDCIKEFNALFDKFCIEYRDQAWYSRYWTYYRAGISRQTVAGMYAGWIMRDFGAAHVYKSEDGYYLFGFDVGDLGGLVDNDAQNVQGGKHPYENEYFNLEQPPIIFSDAEKYDEIIG